MLTTSSSAQSHRTESVKPQFILRRHSSSVMCVSFGPSQSRYQDWIVSGDSSGVILLWDLITREAVASVEFPATAAAPPRGSTKLQGVVAVELHVLQQDERRCGVVLAQGRSRLLCVFDVRHADDDDDGCVVMVPTHSIVVPQHGFCRFASYNRFHSDGGKLAPSLVLAVPDDAVCLPMYVLAASGEAAAAAEGLVVLPMLQSLGSCRIAPEASSSSSGQVAPRYGQLMSLKLHDCSTLVAEDDFLVSVTTWESGHVALFQPVLGNFTALGRRGEGESAEGNMASEVSHLQVVHRCFPEPAMCAALSRRTELIGELGDRFHVYTLVAASAEGSIHGYSVRVQVQQGCDQPQLSSTGEEADRTVLFSAPRSANVLSQRSLSVVFVWEQHIPKGLETCVLSRAHEGLLLCGGWDGLIRLFDVQDGAVVTILTQHNKNAIASLSSFDSSKRNQSPAAASSACFWFSSRASRSVGGEEADVFAAGSSDGTISIWAPLVILPTVVRQSPKNL